MNDKQNILNKIVDIVVSCCATEVDDKGTLSMTRDDVLGKSRAENCVLTREILVGQIVNAGYSITTISLLLNRTAPAVRHLLDLYYNDLKRSRAFRLADAQATLLCKEIE